MTRTRVAALYLHPIKSAVGIEVDELTLDLHGAIGDRRWMLVDVDGVAITRRELHTLTRVHPHFVHGDRNGPLRVDADGHAPLALRVPDDAPARRSRIFSDEAVVHDAGDEAARWMTAVTGRRCRVVRVAEKSGRSLQPKYIGGIVAEGREIALSDGAPLLILGKASIASLNDRLSASGEAAVGVERFRPNILLDGGAAHVEDTWTAVRIGDVTIGVGSECLRCVITTIDERTMVQGAEPLRTLATYRRQGSGAVFGMNATNASIGTIRVGDEVQVLGYR